MDTRLAYASLEGFGRLPCLFSLLLQVGPPVKCQRILETLPGVNADVWSRQSSVSAA